ncbi:MAG: aspartate carbamoyltransferase [Candidatus Curtissbacteria bacterium]|nr:aspartate carbamoyltransferase [Candidatus Curtissbacteria bacterium]
MKLKHVVSATQFDTDTLRKLFNTASKIKNGNYPKKALNGKIMAAIFYEPSTRTRLSFEAAMQRLGGQVISTENASQFSSASKGETLEDTVRIISSYADVIVLRHFSPGASDIASKFSSVPVINAGDGNGEHPTQALLDLFTIFGKFSKNGSLPPKFTVAMVGDLTNGRTIHSLSYLLSLYPKVKIIFVSPKALTAPNSLTSHLREKNIDFLETEDFKYALKVADVVYQTRIQKERFKGKKDYKKYFGSFILDNKTISLMKRNAAIMHPLPRVNEINPEIDDDKRSIYFEQAQNGLYIRMALLLFLFDKA